MSDKNSIDIEKLQFIRVFTPQHIPKYLVEQVKERDYGVDEFYEFQEINCLQKSEKGPVLNPLNLLYVITNEEKMVKGFCWMIIDPLTKDLVIQTFSMDKEYWGKGRAVELLTRKVKEILKELSLNKVYWITKHPKHSIKYGFKPSKFVLMEHKGEENGRNEQTSGSSVRDDSTAKDLHQSDSPAAGPGSDSGV